MLTNTQTAQNVPPLLAPSISVRLSTPELQKQEAPVLQQPLHQQTVEAEPYPESAAQWLAEVLNLLIDIVERNPDINCALITEQNYKQLLEVLEDLIYGIGEDESHPLWSSMAFVGGLIKRYEDEHFPKLTDLFPELKEDPPVKAASPNRKSTVPVWTETEIATHAFFCIGGLFSQIKSHKKAISAYDMTLRLNSNFAEAYYNRGTAKTFVAQYESALTDFDEAIRLKPKFVAAYYNRGLTKLTLDQNEAADNDLQIALKLAEQQDCDNTKVTIQQRLEELNNTK